MVAEPHRRPWSVDEYFWLERNSPVKHEYVDGIVYALAGGTRANSRIANNLGHLLGTALWDRPCRVFDSDIRIRVSPTIYRYPDVAVSCDPRDDTEEGEELDYIGYPTLIAEVLSGSTARADRTTKFDEYQTIKTMREYLLIEAERMAVHVHRRHTDGTWPVGTYLAGNEIVLESIGVRLRMADLYHKVRLRQ